MKTFYTYIYRDPSRNNEPFYVGKGQGRRAYSQKSRAEVMIARLRAMKAEGVEPIIEVIPADDEDQAFFRESVFITAFGRKDQGLGPLLNMTNGGRDEGGGTCSTETRAKMSASHQKRHAAQRDLLAKLLRGEL